MLEFLDNRGTWENQNLQKITFFALLTLSILLWAVFCSWSIWDLSIAHKPSTYWINCENQHHALFQPWLGCTLMGHATTSDSLDAPPIANSDRGCNREIGLSHVVCECIAQPRFGPKMVQSQVRGTYKGGGIGPRVVGGGGSAIAL